MNFNILAVFKWIFSRIGFFYFLIVLLAIMLIDFNAASSRIRIRRLNDARPDMAALVSFGQGEIQAEKLNWKPYLNYFSLVVDYMPGEETTRMFLGVCEYYTGDTHKKAWPYIQHAAEKYPFIFWSVYNAGVLAFERGDMELAARYLNRALILPPERANTAIQGSILYRQVMSSYNFNTKIPDEISAARENIYLLLSAASFYTKDYEKSKTLALYALSTMNIKDKKPFYFYAGVSSMGLGQGEEGVTFLSKCIELKSHNPLVYRYVGEILKASGKLDEGEGLLKTAKTLEARQKDGFPYPDRLRLRFF